MFKILQDSVDKFKNALLKSGDDVYQDDYYEDEEDDYGQDYIEDAEPDAYESDEDPMQDYYSRGGAARRIPEKTAKTRSSYQDKVLSLGYNSVQPVQAQASAAPQITPETVIAYPKEMSEATKLCNYIREQKQVVVDLTGVEPIKAQRLADYLGGVAHATDAKTERVNNFIFVIAPKGYSITRPNGMEEKEIHKFPALKVASE